MTDLEKIKTAKDYIKNGGKCMTVAEIKKYIDLQISNSKQEEQTDFQMTHRLYRANMRHIRLMLDELEPKEKEQWYH